MGTKSSPGVYDCHAAAEADEPIFTLRANDPLAPGLVRGWAMQRVHQIFQGMKPNRQEQWLKVGEAIQCAADMETWRMNRHPPIVAAMPDVPLPGEAKPQKPN